MTNDQTVTQALEPCPFCGAEDIRTMVGVGDGDRGYSMLCGGCGIRQGSAGRTKEQAITAWNTRTAHSGECRSNDDSPVALLHENAADGEMEVALYHHGAGCLTDADRAAGWTEHPLYAHPPREGRSNGRGEALAQAVVAAIECGMVPKSSAREGGAVKHTRAAQVADMLRDALAKVKGAPDAR